METTPLHFQSQLIAGKGYPVEEHNVTTRDSYVLMMQRIPAGRTERSVQFDRKPAVILMCGLQGSSADFVVNMPDQSLVGFILADNGYDVWLTNVRGTRYSSHLHLKKSSREFWDFSLDEMISYDLPDQIDTVLNVTQQEALLYVGWSQGTAIMFGLLASKPEYNKKILLFNAFAPVAFLGHLTAILKYFVPFSNPLTRFFQFLFNGAVVEKEGAIFNKIKKLSCGSIKQNTLCITAFYSFNGGFPIEWNKTRLPVYLANAPSGTSVRNINHFAQLVKSNRLQKYDWGHVRNIAKYGKVRPWPPAYDLSSVTARVALYWSDGDVLATPRDVRDLSNKLPNVVLNYKVPVNGFTHVDFGWSIKAKDHLYKKVLEMMSAYSPTRQKVPLPKEAPELPQ
ncbi:lipase lipl-5-like [Dermacentor variabilis]|uniref:lipase lipl-5-like n=1 Tax=Dermacentor variabilis TaxID=34621 RepID=UPI003F5C905B